MYESHHNILTRFFLSNQTSSSQVKILKKTLFPSQNVREAGHLSQSVSVLLEIIDRIGHARTGYQALRIHLSQLRSYNRIPAYLQLAGDMAVRMSRSAGADSFQLPNHDIVIVGKGITLADMEGIVSTIRALFVRDPLATGDSGDGQDHFRTMYHFPEAFESFKADIAGILQDDSRTKAGEAEETIPRLDPMTLDSVIHTIDSFDLSPIIRRQTALRFDRGERSSVAFEEHFISMADLPEALAVEADMISSRWLFLYLSASLDRYMLDWFSDVRLNRKKAAISLNLNIESLFTPVFHGFEDRLNAAGVPLVVELQMPDVFADLGAYFFARDWLHERGHEVLLDGVRDTTVQLTDIGLLKTDLIKLLWTPRLADSLYGAATVEAVEALGLEKIVLAHCDSEQAVRWGSTFGVSCFQGNFIDTMLATMVMHTCDKSANCTLKQCSSRRTMLAGRTRLECENHTMLDSLPSLPRLPVENTNKGTV